MDGFFPPSSGSNPTGRRRTLKAEIGCVGVGLHGGRRTTLRLLPAPPGTGLRFRRTDTGREVAARYDAVVDTRLCTVLGAPGDDDARIGTVEHLLAAFAAAGIDDALVTVDGPELPILDGSAAPFLFLIDCAGTLVHGGFAETIEVLRPVRVQEGEGADAAWAMLEPHAESGLAAALTIDFPGTAIGRQSLAVTLDERDIRDELADARTFTLAGDVERLQAAGLALGGSLDNAVVVQGTAVLNPGGLRRPDEFVRHKLLDVAGDLLLAGAPLRGRFTGHRSGHALNNRLLRALFADAANWRLTTRLAADVPARVAA